MSARRWGPLLSAVGDEGFAIRGEVLERGETVGLNAADGLLLMAAEAEMVMLLLKCEDEEEEAEGEGQ